MRRPRLNTGLVLLHRISLANGNLSARSDLLFCTSIKRNVRSRSSKRKRRQRPNRWSSASSSLRPTERSRFHPRQPRTFRGSTSSHQMTPLVTLSHICPLLTNCSLQEERRMLSKRLVKSLLTSKCKRSF